MSKRRVASRSTKKHLARAERERIQRNWIFGGTIATAVVLAGILVYGWVSIRFLQPDQPVAIVDGEGISTRNFQARVRFELASGADPITAGSQILQDMIDDVIIRKEAERQGIAVTDTDIDIALQGMFGFYPEGTPTSVPTSTPDPTALAEAASETPDSAGTEPTPTQLAEPEPTPYTQEMYEENLASLQDTLEVNFNVSMGDYRALIASELNRERFRKTFEDQVSRDQEQVNLRHILLGSEEDALGVLSRLEDGESWEDLAAELSQDLTTKENGGNLGWFTMTRLLSRFGQTGMAALTSPIGEIVGPIESTEGWHILFIEDRAVRPLAELAYQQELQNMMNQWLQTQRGIIELEVKDYWVERIPPAPTAIP
jgi:peptidyl-prolyl cis-trans isomerase D